MGILKVESRRAGFKLVGISIPTEIHNYLSLFTLARGITKSDLFRVLIDDWMTNQKSEETDNELIQELAVRVNNEWQAKKKLHPRASLNEFKTSLEKELISKGMRTIQIISILNYIKD